MKIYCETFKQWTMTIAELVREGITFEASCASSHPEYTIELTGGY